jgi:hypothetical protein
MKRSLGTSGTSLPVVMVVTAVLYALLFHSLMRTEVGHRLVRDRYLGGVARDLAENGIEVAKLSIAKGKKVLSGQAQQRTLGRFAHCIGKFEVSVNGIGSERLELISVGKLVDRRGRLAYSARVTARLRRSAEGRWQTVQWREQGLKIPRSEVK